MLQLSNTRSTLLTLVRLGIGKEPNPQFPGRVNWPLLVDLAFQQGVDAITNQGLLDYYDTHPQLDAATEAILQPLYDVKLTSHRLKLLGRADFMRRDYRLFSQNVARLAKFYAQHDIPMMLLKGLGLSLNYPDSGLRPNGDIDIYLFGKWREADQAIRDELGIEVKDGVGHHTIFAWGDASVENHYNFLNIRSCRSHAKMEPELKQLAEDRSHTAEIDGQTIYLPSPNLNALFLLRHNSNHFASTGISLRHVLDWAFFVEKQGTQVDWAWLMDRARRYNMHRFLACIDRIAVDYLGFSPSIFPVMECDSELVDKVLQDIFEHENMERDANLFQRIKRRASRGWQFKICFSESRLSYMITSLWKNVWYYKLKHI